MIERPQPGSSVLLRWRKWDGSPHWQHETIYLGTDEHGDWIGQGRGWRTERPGWTIPDFGPVVMLVPAEGRHIASLFPAEAQNDNDVYVDLAWDVRWNGTAEITGIDMDLDVIRLRDRTRCRIDDEDEWEEHRVAYGYPDEPTRALPELAARLLADVTAGTAPYDAETCARWVRRLNQLIGSR